ncbi:MAG: hypothetical protein K6F33_06110 [Bacteroidales bacterium]|nr:hypothetical protein [Bacteroidales bacterium]
MEDTKDILGNTENTGGTTDATGMGSDDALMATDDTATDINNMAASTGNQTDDDQTLPDDDMDGIANPAHAPLSENDEDAQAYSDMVHDDYVDIINTKVYNAQRMLSFMLENGIDVDKELIQKVAEARDSINTSKWRDVECDFFATYETIVKRIYPIDIDMLNKPSKIDKEELSGITLGKRERERRKTRSAYVYSIATLCLMLLLLGVQVFYFLGSTRLNEIASSSEQLEKMMKRQMELQVLTNAEPDNMPFALELEENISKCDELNNALQSNILLLEPWTKKISRLTFNTRENRDINTENKENAKTNIEVIQEAKGYALILGIYILPLLYGLIGGLTYVLRELRSNVRKYTLDKESTIKYILRIILGAVAGMSVGLFWSDIENAQAVGFTSISLSPMLLAFIAGYCVEHVLGFIDKIIKNVFDNLLSKSNKNDDKAAQASAASQKGEASAPANNGNAKQNDSAKKPVRLAGYARR